MDNKTQFTSDDVDIAFQTGEVFDAPNNILIEYLKVLNTSHVPNDMVRHRETNRCITVNTIINLRLAEKIDRGNTRIAIIVLILALVDVVASVSQALK